MTSTLIIEIIALILIVISMADGYRKGLLMKLFGLGRFVVMIVITIVLTPIIYMIMPLEPGVKEGASILLALILAAIVLFVVASVLKVVDRIPVIHTLNRLGGALVGLVFGVLAIWVILIVLGSFSDVEWCKNVTTYVKDSPILSFMLKFNPVDLLKNA